MATEAATSGSSGARWEDGLEETWRTVQESADGTLSVAAMVEDRRRHLRKLRGDVLGSVKRGMMRNLLIVIDASQSMHDIDMRPTRMTCVLETLPHFIRDFFSQNPISNVGLLETHDGRAYTMSGLSGSCARQLQAISQRKIIPSGEPSLQNVLHRAQQVLGTAPAHASREVLIVYGSLSTCDPGDIHATIQELKNARIKCSVIHLAAAVNICETLCRETGGRHVVALDETHFKDVLLSFSVPPPGAAGSTIPTLLPMGFPKLETGRDGGPCVCCKLDSEPVTKVFAPSGYHCPRCKAKHCDLPTECRICGLHLVSAPHIARSYHHLFPVAPFEEVKTHMIQEMASVNGNSQNGVVCDGCDLIMSTDPSDVSYKCPSCSGFFCFDCDTSIHEIIYNCPKCIAV